MKLNLLTRFQKLQFFFFLDKSVYKIDLVDFFFKWASPVTLHKATNVAKF